MAPLQDWLEEDWAQLLAVDASKADEACPELDLSGAQSGQEARLPRGSSSHLLAALEQQGCDMPELQPPPAPQTAGRAASCSGSPENTLAGRAGTPNASQEQKQERSAVGCVLCPGRFCVVGLVGEAGPGPVPCLLRL